MPPSNQPRRIGVDDATRSQKKRNRQASRELETGKSAPNDKNKSVESFRLATFVKNRQKQKKTSKATTMLPNYVQETAVSLNYPGDSNALELHQDKVPHPCAKMPGMSLNYIRKASCNCILNTTQKS